MFPIHLNARQKKTADPSVRFLLSGKRAILRSRKRMQSQSFAIGAHHELRQTWMRLLPADGSDLPRWRVRSSKTRVLSV